MGGVGGVGTKMIVVVGHECACGTEKTVRKYPCGSVRWSTKVSCSKFHVRGEKEQNWWIGLHG